MTTADVLILLAGITLILQAAYVLARIAADVKDRDPWE